MAIGNAPTVAQVNNKAGLLACKWQRLAFDMQQFTNATGAMNAAALQALGFTAGDAAAAVTAIAQMATFAGVYYGSSAQASTLSYDSQFRAARGTW